MRRGKSQKQAVAIALRKAGLSRKRNPLGGSLLKNPLVWVVGGAAVAWGGYALWTRAQAASAASASANATQIAQMQAELTKLQAISNPDKLTLIEIDSLRAGIRSAGGVPT